MKKGDRFKQQFKITNTVYTKFIDLFKDNNPLHTNLIYAKEKGFRGKVMHGNILNGFLSYFVGECLVEKNVIIQKQNIQFHKPVYLNDKLLLEVEVKGIFESVKTAELAFRFINQLNQKVADGMIQIGFFA